VHTVEDFLDGIERADGEAVAELLSDDLTALFDSTLSYLKLVASEDGVLARDLLERYNLDADPWEISYWELPDLIGLALESSYLLDLDAIGEIESESIDMQGRSARVTLGWTTGFTATFDLVWEDGDWRLSGTSLMSRWF
jgi:hypothetical protein